jgi:hypothetical protein
MQLFQTLCVVTLLATTCMGQAVAPEPEFADVFYRLDGEKLIPLERQTATTKGGASGFIYVKMKMVSDFPGAKSPVRFPAGALTFIVRTVPYASGDPNSMYVLRKLEQRKSGRRLTVMAGHFSPVGGSVSTNFAQGGLPVEFARHGGGSLKMTTGALTAGEYAVSKAYGQAVFCFGVD